MTEPEHKKKTTAAEPGWRVLVNAARDLASARDLQEVAAIVRAAARSMVEADGATFVLREKDLCHYVDEEAIKPLWKGKRFQMDACISGWVIKHREPALIPDVFSDERIPADLYKPTFVKSMLMVPILKEQPLGAIGVYWAHKNKPTMKGLELVQALADITAVTIQNITLKNTLETRVKQRTHELQEVIAELETFTYSVSHDLRAPLRGISGFGGILLEEHSQELSEEALGLLKRLMVNSTQMSRLLDDLLNYFRIGRKEIIRSELPMTLMAQEIADELKSLVASREITFMINEMPEASADNQMIKELWYNLISNAIKFTEKTGPAQIEIGYSAGGAYYVKDNGVGFEMAYYHKLFGVFQRLHSQREYPGNGTGLALAKKIVSRHGGRIWAESKPGETCFYFTL